MVAKIVTVQTALSKVKRRYVVKKMAREIRVHMMRGLCFLSLEGLVEVSVEPDEECSIGGRSSVTSEESREESVAIEDMGGTGMKVTTVKGDTQDAKREGYNCSDSVLGNWLASVQYILMSIGLC